MRPDEKVRSHATDFKVGCLLSDEGLHFQVLTGVTMADFKALLASLRQAEAQFEKQLAGIRAALSSLEVEILATAFRRPRRRRRMSAAARAKISAAQKRRWAKEKAAPKG